jgi:hypothetical protein
MDLQSTSFRSLPVSLDSLLIVESAMLASLAGFADGIFMSIVARQSATIAADVLRGP